MNLKQPIARVTPVSDTYFGVTITDPYRWMEDSAQEEFQTWLTAQNDYTRAWLDTQPGRAELVQQILELRQTGPRLFDVKVAGDRMFAIRLEPGQLVARRLPDGPEEVLYDPHQGATKAQPLAWYVPSPNGRQVLFNVLVEQDTYRVLDCMTGTIRDHGITGAGYDDGSGRGQPYWLADSSGFFYNKNNSMWLHRLGDTPDQDRVIWGPETMPGTIVPGDAAFVVTVPSSRWMLGLIFHGDRHEFSVYHAPLTTLADPDWRKVAGIEDGVVGYVLHGDTAYLRTHRDAPRYKVVAVPLDNPDMSTAPTLVAPGDAVIQGMLVAGDYLLVQDLDGGIARLRRVLLAGGKPEQIALPVEGSIDLFNNWNSMPMANDNGADEVFFILQSWTTSPCLYRCTVSQRTVADTGWIAPSPHEVSSFISYQQHVPGHDGTLIPLTLIHRRDLTRDGTHPAIVYAYGSYGLVTPPFFWAEMLAWYERGGVLAIAGVRGGGEYGREWHEAGILGNKANTVADFIACAEHLVEQQYASPGTLAAYGISAGSYPAGGALVRRPDLWAAIIINVGEPNTIRKEHDTQAAIPEIGSTATEEGFAALRITDSYSRVEDDVAYPAVLLTTGGQDPIVPTWQLAKMAARLQAATASHNPILLSFMVEMGHIPGTEQQWADVHADTFVFILAAMKR